MKNEYFIVDLETIPNKWEGTWLEEFIQKKLEHKRGDNKDANRYCSLTPELGRIVCIGLYDSVEDEYTVLKCNPLVPHLDEAKILSRFWDFYKDRFHYRVVSFNGKTFDANYIHKRSCILNVDNYGLSIPARRYDTVHHYDILEVLTNFYTGEMLSLDVYCKLYGLNPDKSTSGSQVYELFQHGELNKIYNHCLADVHNTNELYLKLKNYL